MIDDLFYDPIVEAIERQKSNQILDKSKPRLNIERLFVSAIDKWRLAPMRQKVIWLKQRGNYTNREIAGELRINLRRVRRILETVVFSS